jgi:hypothetical protein
VTRPSASLTAPSVASQPATGVQTASYNSPAPPSQVPTGEDDHEQLEWVQDVSTAIKPISGFEHVTGGGGGGALATEILTAQVGVTALIPSVRVYSN